MGNLILFIILPLFLALPFIFRFFKNGTRLFVTILYTIPIIIHIYALLFHKTVLTPNISGFLSQFIYFIIVIAVTVYAYNKKIIHLHGINILLLALVSSLYLINLGGAALQNPPRFCSENNNIIAKSYPGLTSDPSESYYARTNNSDITYQYIGTWTEINGTNIFEHSKSLEDHEHKDTYACIVSDIEKNCCKTSIREKVT